MPRFPFFPILLVVLGWSAGSAHAHKMEVRAVLKPAVDGQPARIEVEAWYEPGESASGEAVLTGADGQQLATTQLDPDQGTCTFPLVQPTPGTYKITVDDGAGHREWVMLTIADDHPSVVTAQSAQRNRWLMGVIGLAIIAALTLLASRRKRTPKTTSE